MRKRLFVSALILVLCMGLVSCGTSKDDKKDASVGNVSEDGNKSVENKGTEEEESSKSGDVLKYGFDESILGNFKTLGVYLAEFGGLATDHSSDGKITDEEREELSNLVKDIDKVVVEVKKINERTVDEEFKKATTEFMTKMEEYSKLFFEGLKDDEKMVAAGVVLKDAGESGNKALSRAMELMQK